MTRLSGAWRTHMSSRHPQDRWTYLMCTPLMALEMTSRWISEVPSKIV